MSTHRALTIVLSLMMCSGCAANRATDTAIAQLTRSAEANYQLGKLDVAERQYDEVLRAQPSNAAAHARLGSIAYRKGDAAVARRHFEQATDHDPGQLQAKYNLAMLDLNDASRLLREYIARAPPSPSLDRARAILRCLTELASR
jgi:Flp pilus assembly protein TadD